MGVISREYSQIVGVVKVFKMGKQSPLYTSRLVQGGISHDPVDDYEASDIEPIPSTSNDESAEGHVVDILKSYTTSSVCSAERMVTYLASDQTTASEKKEEAKTIYLRGLSHSTVQNMMSARQTYLEWHKAVYGTGKISLAVSPLTECKIKSFAVDLFKAGYAPVPLCTCSLQDCAPGAFSVLHMAEIVLLFYIPSQNLIIIHYQVFSTNIISKHLANSQESPKKRFPSLAGSLRRFFKSQAGEVSSFSRQPLFPQDVEHLIDTCGVQTPKQLQRSRAGSFTAPKRRLNAESMLETLTENPPPIAEHMKLGSISFSKDEQGLSMTNMKNKMPPILPTAGRPYHFTPLEAGSPYDPAILSFILLASRGAFLVDPLKAYGEGNFQFTEEAKSWPLLCQNTVPLKSLRESFNNIALKAGFDSRKITHHCNRAGMATTFIIERSIEQGGIFPQDAVPTMCRLAGWSEGSGVWAMYVKDVFERYIDTSGLLYGNLRGPAERVSFLRNIATAYNYRLMAPQNNFENLADCSAVAEFSEFFYSYKDKAMGCTMKDALLVTSTSHLISV
ncbi:hypothetical protein OS493_031477 [Desmophyllum pertusum]|uniref:Uncharacterized protein n=1 Tax=Desmophyllum pertusum TaxID=174260 RepID=A0A9W9ZKF5_9CNID|nr:hypothetical protein OS493_031477 [Desmophyllum pertusum]